jgi:ribosomal protein L11 methylase PrmA
LAEVLRDLLSQGLASALAPDGVIVMSGILEDQTRDLLSACQGAGLVLVETLAEADWRALVLKREPPPASGGGEYR